MMKFLGAIFIIAGCSGVGFSMCRSHRRLEQEMQQLAKCLDWMVWELNYRMPVLSLLCRDAADTAGGTVRQVLQALAEELDAQLTPDAAVCMEAAVANVPRLHPMIKAHFLSLGKSLGRFDLQGQIAGLEAEAALCRRELENLSRNRELRLRNYQTLGVCAGVALVILFL